VPEEDDAAKNASFSAGEAHSLGNDDDALRADGEPLAILLGIVPDLHAGRDVDVLVDDRPPDARPPPDLDAFEEDALRDVRVELMRTFGEMTERWTRPRR